MVNWDLRQAAQHHVEQPIAHLHAVAAGPLLFPQWRATGSRVVQPEAHVDGAGQRIAVRIGQAALIGDGAGGRRGAWSGERGGQG